VQFIVNLVSAAHDQSDHTYATKRLKVTIFLPTSLWSFAQWL